MAILLRPVLLVNYVAQIGTHSELMALGGEYAKLNARQVDALA